MWIGLLPYKTIQCIVWTKINNTFIILKLNISHESIIINYFHIALECGCNALGSVSPNCNDGNGKCTCISRVTGIKCTECIIGFNDFPNCVTCADGYYASAGINGVNPTCSAAVWHHIDGRTLSNIWILIFGIFKHFFKVLLFLVDFMSIFALWLF